MKKLTLMLVFSVAIVALSCADGLKKSQIKDIAEQYIEAINDKDFDKWSQLMLSPGNLDKNTFKEKLEKAVSTWKKTEFDRIEIGDIEKTKTGFDIFLKFEPQVRVLSPTDSGGSTTQSTYWIQMLPDGKIKYDIIVPHPIPFAMYSCCVTLRQLEKRKTTKSGVHLKEYGIPLFGYDSNAPIKDQLKSLRKINQWLLDEGEDWDITEPKIPCPEELYESKKKLSRSLV